MIAVGVGSPRVVTRSLDLFPSTVDHKCRPSLSIKRSYGRGWDSVTVRSLSIFDQTVVKYFTASEDFDHLLFEFGLELDEDVS